jgi:hypothetical protein
MLRLVGKLYKIVFVDGQNVLVLQLKAGSRDKVAHLPGEYLRTAFVSAFSLNVCEWIL